MPGGVAAAGEEAGNTLGRCFAKIGAHEKSFDGGMVFGLAVSAVAAQSASVQAHPRDGEIGDADTLAWWHTTEALSGDAMEGRDTGSAAYERAAEYVAKRFKAAGLMPAGDDGTYFQRVPMHEVDVGRQGPALGWSGAGRSGASWGFWRRLRWGLRRRRCAKVGGADVSRVLRQGGDGGRRGARWWCALGRSGRGCRRVGSG